ncbi:hypothetical protein [Methanococcoides burtonii]|uniref:Uncharacterized protein n=1 Tax=Methanococcoides burtonii (strain DSM 6242 / NBRC 107633 / OCM 468 / ACE-M) TaxID=259564 RepID=Q12TR8_METBU|nr:hypothetical protein [Methanococcoides burtonii]ABE53158.1 Hypothetical protein Mbur_2302 [Methanococcoides burtonii DSM 6242]
MVCESTDLRGWMDMLAGAHKMKIRIEILDDEGKESTSIEFAGENVKERVIKFIDTLDETQTRSTGSSSAYLHSGQNAQQLFSQQNSQPVVLQPPQGAQNQYNPVNAMPASSPVPPMYPGMQMPTTQVPYPQYYVPVNQQNVNPSVNPVVNQPVNYIPPQQQQQPAMSPPNMNVPSVVQPTVTEKQVPQVNNEGVSSTSLRDRILDTSLTISERLELFLKYEHSREWSTSKKIQQHYESIYGEIKLSTVSTYLSRMYRKNLLERRGNRTQREYLYIGDMEEVVSQPVQQGYPVWQIQRT